MRVVHDDLRLRFGDLLTPCDLREECVAVGLADAWRLEDATDVLERDAPQVLAEEDRLDLSLLRLVHVEGLLVEELHVADARVERRYPHVHAAGRADAPRVEPADGKRCLRQVSDVDARAHDPAHESSLQHAARAVLVTIHGDRGALLQRGRVGGPEPRDELGREVDVDDPRDTEPAEERAATLGAPDEARADDRSGLDLLVGPDPDLRTDARVIVHDRVIADHAPLFEDHP